MLPFLFFAEFFNSPFVSRSPFAVYPRPGCRRISPASGYIRRRPARRCACSKPVLQIIMIIFCKNT
nr:MAG TPA: hypothetical protein [Caudoviricetes sp.]